MVDLDVQPRYVPRGYQFGWRRLGADAGGFWGVVEQAIFVYTPGGDPHDPLVLCVASDEGAELIGTEGKEGLRVDLGLTQPGVYHDGLWKLGPGPDEQQAGDLLIHWDSGNVHSITFPQEGRVVGIRGSRNRGVGLEELMNVAKSLAP